jgi:acyl dehydratase
VGEVIDSPETYEITRERLLAFAAEFDPQPMHTDEAAAAAGPFGELVASGWQTLAVTMRLLVGSPLFDSGQVVGVGLDQIRWLKPVRPGDFLRARAEILSMRPSASRPSQGFLVARITTLADEKAVASYEVTMMVPRRPA